MRRFVAVVFADPEDGGYVAYIPGVPGVVDQGETEEEAYENVTKALIEFIEKYKNERIARELTEAYANIDQNEDVDFLNNAILHYDPRFADE